MSFVHRKLWAQTTKQWGPASRVQANLFNRLDAIGIDPNKAIFAYRLWSPGIPYNYAGTQIIGAITNGTPLFQNGSIYFDGSSYYENDGSVENSYFRGLSRVSVLSSFSANSFADHTAVVNEASLNGANGWALAVYGSDIRFWINHWSGNVAKIAISTGVDYTVIGTHNADLSSNNINIYANGVKGTPDTYTSAVFTTELNFDIGTWLSPWDGFIKQVVGFGQELNETQSAFLSDNPEYLWQPAPQKTIFLPLAAGVGTTVTGILPAMDGLLTLKKSYHRSLEGSI